jgi:hypothetical protein
MYGRQDIFSRTKRMERYVHAASPGGVQMDVSAVAPWWRTGFKGLVGWLGKLCIMDERRTRYTGTVTTW